MGDSCSRHRIAVQIGLAVMIASAHSLASESFEITMSGPSPDCARADLTERVARLTGTTDLPARASVKIARVNSSLTTVVSIEEAGESRSRTFSTNTCAAALEAAALVIAIGLFPERFGDHPPATSKAARSPTPPVARLFVGPGFDGLALPRPAPTANLGFSLALNERYWFELNALGALPQVVASSVGQAHFQMFGGSLRACYVASYARVNGGACLAGTLLRVVAEGREVDHPRAGASWYGGPGVGALGRLALTPSLGLRLSVDGIASLATRAFELSGDRVHTPGRIDVCGYFGSDFQF